MATSDPPPPSILVVGGAGYIGSHMVKRLAREGYRVTTLDNLSSGHRDAVLAGSFVLGDLLERDDLARLFRGTRFDLVMHFAASALVAESVADPRRYYRNNVVGALNLLDAMLDAGASRLIFSSTCATYGVPDEIPLTEGHPQRPINPYGNTKLVIERALADYGAAYGLRSVGMRYFNAAGCALEGDLDERHDPETHLIPLVLREALRVRRGGAREATTLTVLGDDYPTPDGTCVRDYIHVEDICEAHLLAARRLLGSGERDSVRGFEAFNLGNGEGASVLQVIAAAREVTGVDLVHAVARRRPGDPPVLVGSSAKAASVLGYKPSIPRIADIVGSAWRARLRRLPRADA
jgi:UDP-glucose-4-epimerase GalE